MNSIKFIANAVIPFCTFASFSEHEEKRPQDESLEKRVFKVALPFLCLVPIFDWAFLEIATLGKLAGIVSLLSLDETNYNGVKVAIDAVVAVAALTTQVVTSSHLGRVLGSLYCMIGKVLENVCKIYSTQDHQTIKECLFRILEPALHITLVGMGLLTGAPQYLFAEMGLVLFTDLYEAVEESKKEGHQLEVGARLLMAGVRLYSMQQFLSSLTGVKKKSWKEPLGALPPHAQEQREKDAIINDQRFKDLIGDHSYAIDKMGNKYIITADSLQSPLQVIVQYLPREDGRCGPINFSLEFITS
ncbi:MAG: hypothetical protein KGI80_05175 [Verrucomicrobiota bacterium]|nr:hypothetical protein [Verrucomicrobiota bacterium]